MKALALVIAACTCLSFIWAALAFFKAENQGSNSGKKLISGLGFVAVVACLYAIAVSNFEGSLSQWLGLAINAAAFALFWWAIASVKKQPLDFAFSSNAPRQFVAHGAYKFWRHPFYASYLYAWIAAPLISGNPWLWAVPLVMGSLYLKAARQEERLFTQTPFADQYAAYKRKVKVLIPCVL